MTSNNNLTLNISALREEGTERAAQRAALKAIANALLDDDDKEQAQTTATTLVEEHGVISVLVEALQRPENQYGQFYHQTFSVLTLLPCVDPETMPSVVKNAVAVVDDGGLDVVLDFFAASGDHKDAFTTLTAFFVLLGLFKAFEEAEEKERYVQLAVQVLPVVVEQMEQHGLTRGVQESANLFCSGCDLVHMALCHRIPVALYQRLAQVAFHGVSFHRDDDEAQSNGKSLLVRLVGREKAVQMMDHAEMHHCEDANCSCAA